MTNVSRRDIDKYVKFFCVKAAQIIVQSRSGERSSTKCDPNTIGIDWFNIALPNSVVVADVQNEIKTLYGRSCPAVWDCFYVDVILRTSDGADMLVETWSVFASEKLDTHIRVCFTVYNKLAVLLRTLISFTRALPAYRVSRRKNKDFNFMYKVYSGRRQPGRDGDLPEYSSVGSVGTPFYTISVAVAYRQEMYLNSPKMTDTSYPVSRGVRALQRKEDLVKIPEASMQGIVDQIANAASEYVTSNISSIPPSPPPLTSSVENTKSTLSKEIREAIGEIEFIEHPMSTSELQLDKDTLQSVSIGVTSNKSQENLAGHTMNKQTNRNEQRNRKCVDPFLDMSTVNIGYAVGTTIENEGFVNPSYCPMAAFADIPLVSDSLASIPLLPSTPPMLSSLQEKMGGKDDKGDECDIKEVSSPVKTDNKTVSPQEADDSQPQAQAVGFEDDFVLVELRPAFSCREGEAAILFKETQNPQVLSMFTSVIEENGKPQTLKEILDCFEEEFQKFDTQFGKLGYLNTV